MTPAPSSLEPRLVAGAKGAWQMVSNAPRTVLTLERLPPKGG